MPDSALVLPATAAALVAIHDQLALAPRDDAAAQVVEAAVLAALEAAEYPTTKAQEPPRRVWARAFKGKEAAPGVRVTLFWGDSESASFALPLNV